MEKKMFVEILLILMLVYSSESCLEFNERWKNKDCPSPETDKYCMVDGDQSIEISTKVNENYLKIECNYKKPGLDTVKCTATNDLLYMTMDNCEFVDFQMNSFFEIYSPTKLEINYSGNEITHLDIIFDGIARVQSVVIKKYKTGGRFQLKFGPNDNSFLSFEITEHDFTDFERRPFRFMPKLLNLTIRHGTLESLGKKMFKGPFENLSILDLSWNRVKTIHQQAFKALFSLVVLDLTGNKITTFPATLVPDLNSLEELLLALNKLSNVPVNLIGSLPKLMTLNITGNVDINNFNTGLFAGAKALKNFFASNCSLRNIEPSLFSNVQVTETEKNYFLYYFNLIKAKSFSKRIEPITVSNPISKFSTMEQINLSHNKLTTIKHSTFDSLVNLHDLDLSYNPLVTLPPNMPFGSSSSLRNVLLRDCNLRTLPNIQWKVDGDALIDLSHNRIVNVTLPVYTNGKKRVNLIGNNITTISLQLDSQTTFRDKVVYFLGSNKVPCNCDLKYFATYIRNNPTSFADFPDIDLLLCDEENQTKMVHKGFDSMFCPLVDCPLPCSCQGIVMDCTGKGLETPPLTIPLKTSVVRLGNNRINSLSKAIPEYWNSVTNLHLSNNFLSTLNDWPSRPKLKKITLDNNRLEDLPLWIMSMVDEEPNFRIKMFGNRWRCDCESLHLKEWFMKNEIKVEDFDDTVCNIQIKKSSIPILMKEAPLEQLCSSTYSGVIISITLLVTVLFLVLAHVYLYREAVAEWIEVISLRFKPLPHYSINKSMEKKYDVFLCYGDDEAIVVNRIVRRLEPRYKLCIPKRDWERKGTVSSHVAHSIQNSKSTLFLVSKSSIKTTWFQVKIRGAYNRRLEDGRHKLILVLIDDISGVPLKDDIRLILDTESVIKLWENTFWERLMSALPVPKRRPPEEKLSRMRWKILKKAK